MIDLVGYLSGIWCDTPFDATRTKAAINAIASCFESGDPIGNYADVTIYSGEQDDGAGISFGKHQATENSGTLYKLLSLYLKKDGKYADLVETYMCRLYDGVHVSRKGDLTHDQEFVDLIKEAATDPIMRAAQDELFEEEFLKPAVHLCKDPSLQSPIAVAIAYEQILQ